MRVLTIDTATGAAAIGLVDGDTAVDAEPVRDATAAQHVLPLVDALLAERDLGVDGVDRIVVGRGPGSFTGLRIGMATAIGLAAPRGTPLVGVATTAALRHAAGIDAIAVIDARRGEVFAEGPGVELGAYAPADLAQRVPAASLLIGDGATRYREVFAHCSIPADDDPRHVPAAAALAALAEEGAPATPLYIRAPDAIPTAER